MIESERLLLRPITEDDFDELAVMLRDPDVMRAWEHTFSDEQIKAWIARRMAGYAACGHDYWLAVERESGAAVGQIGLLEEDVKGERVLGVGWMLKKACWGRGYAQEGARACIDHAFQVLGETRVIADIRPENTASVTVALRLGMVKTGSFVKHYNGIDMVHDVYELRKAQA